MYKQDTKGVAIIGGPGTGKTSAILQLVDYSCFGRRKDAFIIEEESCSIEIASKSPIHRGKTFNQDFARMLGTHVVAYHFCQFENNVTCLIPDFVHNLSAQLCQSSQLIAYRELILSDPKYVNYNLWKMLF